MSEKLLMVAGAVLIAIILFPLLLLIGGVLTYAYAYVYYEVALYFEAGRVSVAGVPAASWVALLAVALSPVSSFLRYAGEYGYKAARGLEKAEEGAS